MATKDIPDTPAFLRSHPNPFVAFMEHSRTSRLAELAKKTIKENDVVIDMGCGDGGLAEQVLKEFKKVKVYGVDLDKEMLKEAVERNRSKQFAPILSDARRVKLRANRGDMLYCGCVLSHVKDPESVVLEFKRLLKPNGKILIQIPNDDVILFLKQIAEKLRLGLLFPGITITGLAPTHVIQFNLEKAKKLLDGHFTIERISYSPFNFYIYIQGTSRK